MKFVRLLPALCIALGLSFAGITKAQDTTTSDSQILFVRGDPQQSSAGTGIYVLDEATNVTTLLLGGKGLYIYPVWSPDGKQIVFNHSDGVTLNISSLDVNSGKLTQLTDGVYDEAPSWSPNGALIAFGRGNSGPPQNLYTLRLLDKSIDGLTNQTDQLMMPRWNPDGTKLAFVKGVFGSGYEIYLLDTSNNREIQLTKGYANAWLGQSPWSPDGRYLTFDSMLGGQDFKLYILDINTLSISLLAEPNGIVGEQPSWSPDGERLGFARKGDDGIYHIYTVDANGQNLTQITNDKQSDYLPSWRPVSQ